MGCSSHFEIKIKFKISPLDYDKEREQSSVIFLNKLTFLNMLWAVLNSYSHWTGLWQVLTHMHRGCVYMKWAFLLCTLRIGRWLGMYSTWPQGKAEAAPLGTFGIASPHSGCGKLEPAAFNSLQRVTDWWRVNGSAKRVVCKLYPSWEQQRIHLGIGLICPGSGCPIINIAQVYHLLERQFCAFW